MGNRSRTVFTNNRNGWNGMSWVPSRIWDFSARYTLMLLLIMGGMPQQLYLGRTSGQVLEMMGAAAAITWSWKPWCIWECCDKPWINVNNVTAGLDAVLSENLFGQHIVQETVSAALQGHLLNPNPPKPLVLSFHGRTGTGKNFVSRMIAESIYKEGFSSKYVHLKIADRDFRHASKLEEYKESLHNEVFYSAKKCPRQLYIFDEVENMPPGLLDTIRPFLEYRTHLEGVQFNKAIFIFLSNTAAREISNYALSHLQAGKQREEITLQSLEPLIEQSSFGSAGGGFESTRLIDKYLISHFIPFLPLETSHVRKCIKSELLAHHIRSDDTEDIVEEVLRQLQFWPKGLEIFATKGCKSVAEKLNLALFRKHRKRKVANQAHSEKEL
ncbi:torsin-1A-like [Lytechinus pictus]|uniref:torsin-1A-like n=1 Tax=Lytechinus pictus TaxID=7653 RepID=UPI0030BA1AD0